MQFKIGNAIYDDDTLPMMVILTDQDKKNIHAMLSTASKYAIFPDSWKDEKDMRQWMRHIPVSTPESQDQMQTAFNNAINFALDNASSSGGLTFLNLWREGEWPKIAEEFPEFITLYGGPE